MSLDRSDKRILAALQDDARISNQDLAEKVGLSPSSCLRRVRQLETEGYIRGYHCLLDASILGLKLMALVQISMDRHTPDRFEHFQKTVADLPQVLECLLITGQSADFQLKVLVRDMEEYQDFLLNQITRISGVSDVHSSFVLRQVVQGARLDVENLN
jgi:Lrp/AsnC family leucine-responsive transcriptional regulator